VRLATDWSLRFDSAPGEVRPRETELIAMRERAVAEAAKRLAMYAGAANSGSHVRGKRVKNTATGRVYRSTREAARASHTTEWIVQAACNGRNNGQWRYVEEV
jgi:hypothetical protein